MSSEQWVCVSGYFDPFHVGHLEYLQKAKEIGDKLVVIVNSDEQAVLKKGKFFMPAAERCKIIAALSCVDMVVESIDKDRTVCETLRTMEPKPDFFCNGGDQNNNTIPEGSVCQERGIELRDGFGDKIQSSSWLTGRAKAIEIRECIHGKGVFSQKPFVKDEILWLLEGIPQNNPTRTTIHIGNDEHVDDPFGIYFNHSFDPNCKIQGRHVIALRDIELNEHLTFDYTVSERVIAAPFQTTDGKWVKSLEKLNP